MRIIYSQCFSLFFIFLVIITFSYSQNSVKTTTINIVTFDDIKINNLLYFTPPLTKPFIVLMHQSNWNLHEYDDIAPRLQQMGYNSIAIDLRYGGTMVTKEGNKVTNKSEEASRKLNKKNGYMEALIDIKATLNAIKQYASGPVILMGSSISASLALIYASENKGISSVIAFSPGEYFPVDNFLRSSIKLDQTPVLIIGTQEEKKSLLPIVQAITNKKNNVFFTPDDYHGQHGAKILWPSYEHSEDYWYLLNNYLSDLYPVRN